MVLLSSFVVCALYLIVILAANLHLRHTFASLPILHLNLKVVVGVFPWTPSLHELGLRHM